MEALISVVVPIYNVEDYLCRCVDSIISQSHRNLEIILVDDGSPDACGEICDEYAKRDSRVKVIHRQNGGLPAARNTGIDAATGDYISFIDSDDFIEPYMYEELLKLILSRNADVVQGGTVRFSEPVGERCEGEILDFNSEEAVKRLLISDKILTCSSCDKLYRRELLEELRYPAVRSEDFVFNYKVFKKCKKISTVTTPMYHYINRENSITTKPNTESDFEFLELINGMADNEESKALVPYWKIQLAVTGRNFIIPLIVFGNTKEDFRRLRRFMVKARFILISNKYSRDVKLKFHIFLVWLCPVLYRAYIKRMKRKNEK